MLFCSNPFTTINIHETGHIYSCLCGNWHNYGPVGNLNEDTLTNIFSNKNFNQFRQSIFDQTFKYCVKDQCPTIWNLDEVENFDLVKNYTHLPTKLILGIDRNCNLKCGSCRNSVMWEKPVNQHAKKILDTLVEDYKDFNTPVWFQCDGLGDVFASAAYKEFFVRDDLPKCFQFNLTTNGNLITKNLDLLQKIKSKIWSIQISFDAASEFTYKDVRGGKFSSIIDGIKAIKELDINRINASFIIQKKNYLEVVEYVNICKNLGIQVIHIASIDRWPHMSDQWWDENKLNDNADIRYDKLINDLHIVKQSANVTMCGGVLALMSKYATKEFTSEQTPVAV